MSHGSDIAEPVPPPAARGAGATLARRDRVLRAVLEVLGAQKRAAVELQAVVEASGASLSDVQAEFPNLDDLLVALAEWQAEPLCAILRPGAGGRGVRATLTDFGLALERDYSSVFVGFCRVAMTEGSRHRAVRQRVFDGGPGAIAAALAAFLETAKADGQLDVEDCALAAEHLMGLLREPLYRELTLHAREMALSGGPSTFVEEVVGLFLEGCGDRGGAR